MQPAGFRAAAKARRLGSQAAGALTGESGKASPLLKFHLEEISSIITGGRTNNPTAGGENLELSIVSLSPPPHSACATIYP